ncbi:hypothetical protein [Spirosoma flavum]|uniref:Uncharacterized protein n=1 Tax=Spirosoma flavum TaxID=2048557 RepID=A0ABW6AIZ1_9BACT
MNKIFELSANISTPLMLAGFFASAFFFIARQIIKANIFPQLTKQFGGEILKLIIQRLFVLALIAMILGFLGYITDKINPSKFINSEDLEHYEKPHSNLIKLILEHIDAIDVAPRPNEKNLTFKFKVIPKSKNKYVPIKNKGTLLIMDSVGHAKEYTFEVNIDDQGIKPQIVSYLYLDGLINKIDYQNLLDKKNYKVKCIFYYDSDVFPTIQQYSSGFFKLSKTSISDLSNNDQLTTKAASTTVTPIKSKIGFIGVKKDHTLTDSQNEEYEGIKTIVVSSNRRAIYTRMHAQISVIAMNKSLEEFRKVVESNVNYIKTERLHNLVNNIIVELDEIERATKIEISDSDFKLIEKSKVIIIKAVDELCKSVRLNCKRPKNLIETYFFDIDGANNSVEVWFP